jgi:Icc-related predicted phosphoesterase
MALELASNRKEENVMRAVFTSDLHGRIDLYDQLARLVQDESADAVLIGGDLFPSGWSGEQAGFITDFLDPLFKDMGVPVLAVMGNNDRKENLHLVDGSKYMEQVHMRLVDLFGHKVFGYAYVDITPFEIKDWEKFDNGTRTNEHDRLDGMVTAPERMNMRFDPADRSDTIEKDLAGVAETIDARNTIFLFHAPPYGTHCDLNDRGHVGSMAIKDFITIVQPPMTLHGHIHDAPYFSNKWFTKLGRTVCVNPGQRSPELHAAVIDFDEGIMAHTVFDGVAEFEI